MTKDFKKMEIKKFVIFFILLIFSFMNLYRLYFTISELISIINLDETVTKQSYINNIYYITYYIASIIILWSTFLYYLTKKNRFKLISIIFFIISIGIWIGQIFYFCTHDNQIFIIDFVSQFIDQYSLLILNYLFATNIKNTWDINLMYFILWKKEIIP